MKAPFQRMENSMTGVDISYSGNFGRIVQLASALVRVAIRIRQRRELMSLLNQPDYILKDIGLQRHEITREGLKRFWID
jgi:uncharacterized protein YjiS (DUF1127 family)